MLPTSGSESSLPAVPQEKVASPVLSRLTRVFLVLFTVLLTLGGVEVVIRSRIPHSYALSILTHSPYRTKQIHQIRSLDELKDTTGYFFPPSTLINGFVTNSKGFLSPEISYQKPNNIYRIVYIGDSFGVGVVPYQQHFIRLLEHKLNQQNQLSKKIEVINLSVPSIGVREYERLVTLEAMKYQPDLVLISFFVGNDFYVKEDSSYPEFVRHETSADIFPEWKTLTLVQNFFKLKLYQGSPLAVARPMAHTGQVLGVYTGEGIENYSPETPTLSEEKYFDTLTYKPALFKQDGVFYAKAQPIYDNIDRIIQQTQNLDSKLFFMIIPDELQFNQQLAEQVMADTQIDDLFLPQQKITQFLQSRKVPYLDLAPTFETVASPSALYQPRDSHFNTDGNSVTADALYSALLPIIGESTNSTQD